MHGLDSPVTQGPLHLLKDALSSTIARPPDCPSPSPCRSQTMVGTNSPAFPFLSAGRFAQGCEDLVALFERSTSSDWQRVELPPGHDDLTWLRIIRNLTHDSVCTAHASRECFDPEDESDEASLKLRNVYSGEPVAYQYRRQFPVTKARHRYRGWCTAFCFLQYTAYRCFTSVSIICPLVVIFPPSAFMS